MAQVPTSSAAVAPAAPIVSVAPVAPVDDGLILTSQLVTGTLGWFLGSFAGALAVTNSGLITFRICLNENGGCDTTAGDRARDIMGIGLMLLPGVIASSTAVYWSERLAVDDPPWLWTTLAGVVGCTAGTLGSALLWDAAGVHEVYLVPALIVAATVAAEILVIRLLR